MPGNRPQVQLPTRRAANPFLAFGVRLGIAGLIVVANWLLVILERGSYRDSYDNTVSVVDALYYTTVTLTTTGYGDITPITPTARLLNALLVTPLRLVFVILLVGTTVQALTERSRQEFRLARWRSRLKDHVVVLGYGTKGRNAVRALQLKGHPADLIVIVDSNAQAAADATSAGFHVVPGSATSEQALREAGLSTARVVIVALGRDDTAILATLTARRLAPHVTVVASAREAENAELLEQSGAASVIVSSETAGRLLGLATDSPDTVSVVEDLLSFGHGLDIVEREISSEEVGQAPTELPVPILAVVRDGRVLRYTEPSARLQLGDRIVYAQA